MAGFLDVGRVAICHSALGHAARGVRHPALGHPARGVRHPARGVRWGSVLILGRPFRVTQETSDVEPMLVHRLQSWPNNVPRLVMNVSTGIIELMFL